MSNKLKFAIAALAAAGFTSTTSSAQPPNQEQPKSNFLDDIKKIVKSMTQPHEYTVAGHSSHYSHSSHASHGSHRSYYKPPELEDDLVFKSETADLENAASRNENSTPRNTVLPSSPAIAVLPSSPAIAKKLKVLPGNSSKFREVITAAQVALVARGYEAGPINGNLQAKTMAAVFKFQRDSGLLPDGKLTPEVLTALNVVAK